MAMSAHGTFGWNELASTNAQRAMAFYAEVLGWEFEQFGLPDGEYWVAKVDDQMVGGIGGLETGPAGTTTSTWISWIEVDDIDARIERARSAGAEIFGAPEDVPGVGRTAVIRDPAGAVVGFLQSAAN